MSLDLTNTVAYHEAYKRAMARLVDPDCRVTIADDAEAAFCAEMYAGIMARLAVHSAKASLNHGDAR
jgi:hypothetical protein